MLEDRFVLIRCLPAVPVFFSHQPFESFARDVARKFIHKDDIVHPLKLGCNSPIDPIAQFLTCYFVGLVQHNRRQRCLSPFIMGNAEYGGPGGWPGA